MAVYRIFPEKDTTLYSKFPLMNTGMDAILEIKAEPSMSSLSGSLPSRILLKFSDDDISFVKNNYIPSSSMISADLSLYLADATTLPNKFQLFAHPVYENWDMGTGKEGYIPPVEIGSSWRNKNVQGQSWSFIYPNNVTSSYFGEPGGSNWYTSSACSQSFSEYNDKDICMNVGSILNKWMTGEIPNNGFIIKSDFNTEFYSGQSPFKLAYFSRDTNTVFPPTMNIKWRDDSYLVPSSSAVIDHPNVMVSLGNNKFQYEEQEVYTFRINVREQFPKRQFVTSSLFTKQNYLPEETYYAIQDDKTKDFIFNFDPIYTRVSADSKGNYFTVYMNSLEPGRYYKILLKSKIQGREIVFDNEFVFRIK